MSDFNENDKKKDKRGILRLDISKPRNSSGSVEFRYQPELIGQVRFRIMKEKFCYARVPGTSEIGSDEICKAK